MRKRLRMQKKAAEREKTVAAITITPVKAEEKAVTANDNKRTGRKTKAGNNSN